MGLIRPPRLIIPPQGILRPNRAAMARGLSFLQAFQNGPSTPFVSRGAVATASYHVTSTTPELYVGRGNVGLTADGWGGDSAGNTYALSQTAGTVISYLVQYVDSGSSPRRWFVQFGPAGDNQYRMENTGSNLSVGWIAGGVNRLIETSAAGYYSAGVPFTIAGTWDASGQAAYVSGRLLGTGTAGYANTAGSIIAIGYLPGFGFEAGRIKPSALIYTLVLDTALSAAEIAEAEADPWWWVERPPPLIYARSGGAPGPITAEIAGTVDITASVSAEMALDARIAATVDITGSATGALDLAATINGTVPITAEIEARLDRLAEISGTIPITAEIVARMEGGAADTHDGFVRRSRRERALVAAAERRRAEERDAATALRLELEAAMGMAVEAAEEAPESVAEAVPAVVAKAEAAVSALAPARPVDAAVFAEARDIARELHALVAEVERARALAEDDEEVMILLRALA